MVEDKIGFMDFPLPKDAAFRDRVYREIKEADDAIRDEVGLPRRGWVGRPAPEPEIVLSLREPEPKVEVKVKKPPAAPPATWPARESTSLLYRPRWHVRSRWCRLMPFPVVHPQWAQARRCTGCGCLLDWLTEGCQNCEARHVMRLRARVDRVCRMIEEAFR